MSNKLTQYDVMTLTFNIVFTYHALQLWTLQNFSDLNHWNFVKFIEMKNYKKSIFCRINKI